MGPTTREKLRKIFESAAAHPNPNLVRWTVTLSCGHPNDKTADQHHVYRPATAGIAEVNRCSTCGEQGAIIGAERIGPINPPTPASTAPRQAESVASLRRQVKAAEATLLDSRARLETAERIRRGTRSR
jgi:hypothetical protein